MTRGSGSKVAQAMALAATAAAGSAFMVAAPRETRSTVSVSSSAAAPSRATSTGTGSGAVTGLVGAGLLASAALSRRSTKPRRNIVSMQARGGESYDALVKDLEELVKSKDCGPILVRLSWHDAGVFSDGELKGGCPNAAMRFTDAGEGTFGANAGLPDVALGLLKPITEKYVPSVIGNADLWTLAANVAIRMMGGPDIKTRFGRKDAESSSESVESQAGRLPDGDKGIDHLREIFHPKGFTDKDIVALSGAHTVGKCHLDRSGFDGPWTEEPLKFDNTYFKEMMEKEYSEMTTEKGNPQFKGSNGTIMLISDLALLKDPAFKTHVETYAKDQDAYFKDFTAAWIKLQENGCSGLKDSL
ncbi:unnamed protein product [Effrenium voratum]|nr:unnamed protein product [Effrenium voratum]|mmetsp:Transcript_78945/g.189517  ORF Transcript_78945/g.189517 Transcript_78945/m.189517 type:complete len:359 (-) Transcript_78945:106-1182(-)|eukprot:CAMPEP_0181429542 /NCGR_PEP_ID=MMETSP1110-20121109/17256_1 /TAXON_ID=174948 /ORGANISM="Symbiodinium sp., Strain CCMP421" /LENGTH=358 /DNA_ID=CAMNT_0023552819 /DNA_START=59 /DNA_END=1135 /DNA_ORIENTATION=-